MDELERNGRPYEDRWYALKQRLGATPPSPTPARAAHILDGKKIFAWSIETDFRVPPEKKEIDAHSLRRRAGAELYHFLLQYRLPAVVDIEEKSIPVWRKVDFEVPTPPSILVGFK